MRVRMNVEVKRNILLWRRLKFGILKRHCMGKNDDY